MSRKRRHEQPIPPDRTRPVPGAWDSLGEIYDALRDYATIPTTVAGMIRNQEALQQVSDKPLLAQRAMTLATDCKALTEELLSIQATHKNRHGDPRNEDDHMRCVDTHTRYMKWATRFESTAYPTYVAIAKQFGDAIGVDILAAKPTELQIFKESGEHPNDEPAQPND